MDTNDSVMQHVAKVRNMANALINLGEQVSDTAIMAKILASLPTKYNALQTAWDSVDVPRQTLDNLLERLIKEENRLTAEDEAATALAALTVKDKGKSIPGANTSQKGHNNKKRDAECYYCHKKGHFERYCRKKKREMNASGDKSERQKTAFTATCAADRERIRQNIDRCGRADRYIKPTEEQVTASLNKDPIEIWLTDSGDYKHITYRRDWFHDFHPTNGISISLGDDGTCQALGTGTIIIERLVDGE